MFECYFDRALVYLYALAKIYVIYISFCIRTHTNSKTTYQDKKFRHNTALLCTALLCLRPFLQNKQKTSWNHQNHYEDTWFTIPLKLGHHRSKPTCVAWCGRKRSSNACHNNKPFRPDTTPFGWLSHRPQCGKAVYI